MSRHAFQGVGSRGRLVALLLTCFGTNTAPCVQASDAVPKRAPAAESAAPGGMVRIPGGEFRMGTEDPRDKVCGGHESMADARPLHTVRVDAFWMDITEVTNCEFRKFVDATHYLTVAERPLKPDEFPGVPKEKLVPGSVVFTPPKTPVPLEDFQQWWSYVPGANWRHPEGPNSNLDGRDAYPVVQIAFEDAEAFARWAGKRLPTEAEWEFAARGGLKDATYTWGNELRPGGRWMANIFEGHFPDRDTGADGYAGIAPVARFPANGFGLRDMAGNVWEWCSDWYRPDYYQVLADTKGGVAVNPKGPADSVDPLEPGVAKRVHRGGSFLCTDEYCTRYMVGTRDKGEPSTGSNHLGFRCVKPIP